MAGNDLEGLCMIWEIDPEDRKEKKNYILDTEHENDAGVGGAEGTAGNCGTEYCGLYLNP